MALREVLTRGCTAKFREVRVLRSLWAPFFFLCMVEAASAGEFDSSLYDPMASGDFSSFRLDGQVLETATVLPIFESVNGQSTRVIETSGGENPGSRTNATNDASGIRTHRVFVPDIVIPGFAPFDRTVTFSPPIRDVFASFDLGETVRSQGDAFIVDSDGFSITLTYDQTTVIGELERITVPFGTFEAIRIEQTLVRSDGQQTETDTQTLWVAAGLGILKVVATIDGETEIVELEDTNRVFAPEPESAILQLSALSMLALVAAHRTRRSPER